MVDLIKRTVEDIFGKSTITLTEEESREIDKRINDKMKIARRKSNYRLAKSWYEAGKCYVGNV